MPRNYYATLRVSQYAGADEIKKAYKQCALEFHPDKNPTDQESFKLISQAYKVLGDPLARSVYDRVRSDDISPALQAIMDDFKIRLDALQKQAGAIDEKVSAHAEMLKQHGKSIKEMQFKHEKYDAAIVARSVFIPTFKVDEGEQNAITKRKIVEFFAQSFKDLDCSVQEISLLGRKAGARSALVTFGDPSQRNMVLKRAGARNRIDNVILFPARTSQQLENYNKRKVEVEKKQLQALSKKYGNENSGGGS